MGALRTLAALALLTLPGAAAAQVDRWAAPIAEASARFGIPEVWIRRVMQAESAGRTRLGGRPIESRAGAMGLMQLMPATWREMRARLGLGPDPHAPRDNILAGTFYLRLMYDRFGYPGLFAAYNAGPARYAEHLATGRRLPRETVAYLASVAGGAAPLAENRSFASSSLFAVPPGSELPLDEVPVTASLHERGGLFVPLGRVRDPGEERQRPVARNGGDAP
ncbi:lytic transglycosylase domain-containing protein [Sphingosinicella terrae]|uniref:lytic transglycosylase domain-containing protein n=1 Tax=Sphingosinicella terrae TaxID=2172047 RepID=UPI000E0D20F2|nr:lytic transglycosylase domain-containing protein [Sphingosinicella terrae]